MVSVLNTQRSNFESLAVVLGASNVRRSLLPLTRALLRKIPRPANIVFACGHGRSFGQYNNVLGWSLPGLRDAPWREHCLQYYGTKRYVILTDVGNDIFYDHSSEKILDWVQDCLDMFPASTNGVIMGPPITRVEALWPGWFEIMRRVFYPGSKVRRSVAMETARELHWELQKIAFSRGFSWINPLPEWYAWDPIHIRRSAMASAWDSITDALTSFENNPSEDTVRTFLPQDEVQNGKLMSWGEEQRLRRAKALEQWWLGKNLGATQPWMTLDDGSTISFF
jgi:hypothetical protein